MTYGRFSPDHETVTYSLRAPTQELQGEFLSTIRKSQDTVRDAIKAWADAVHSLVPQASATT
jgi:hypothetical protein